MPPFVIAVHAGAGFHSVANEHNYRRICQRACEEARLVLEADGDCTQAVVKAIKVLEDSEFTNAGYGSNLNIDGAVECDASVMEGSTGSFGAVGAVSQIRNPIDAAYALHQQERRRVFPSGRIPPLFLVGSGAEKWVSTQGVSLLSSSQSLIAPCAQAKYQHYHRFAQAMDSNNEVTVDTAQSPSRAIPFDELNDTVGAVCQDYQGNTAAGVSSGGVLLKFPGRVGEAAMFGAGCWAEQGNREHDSTSSACSVTGTGEQIIRTMFAKNCVDIMTTSEDPNAALHDLLTTKFTNATALEHYPLKQVGFILLQSTISPLGRLMREFTFAHTTQSMALAYLTENMRKPQALVSRLDADRNGSSPYKCDVQLL